MNIQIIPIIFLSPTVLCNVASLYGRRFTEYYDVIIRRYVR
jgi:hypothetical protein